MDMAKFREMFLAEASDHVQQMTATLISLETDPADGGAIDALFRNAHSIKGMAGTMGFTETANLAHYLEDTLDVCRQEGHIGPEQIDLVLSGVDFFDGLLSDIRSGGTERDVSSFISATGGQSQQSEPEQQEESAELIEIELDEPTLVIRILLTSSTPAPAARLLVILKTLQGIGHVCESKPSDKELLTGEDGCKELYVRFETEQSPEQISAYFASYSEIEDLSFPAAFPAPAPVVSAVKKGSGVTVRVNTELLDNFINLTGELITTRYHLQNAVKNRCWNDVDEGVGQLTRLVKNLHHKVLQVRMLSLENIFIRVARTVRDLARTSGKEVHLNLVGATIEIDRAIVEELTDPLIHLVRNAIDHGITEQGTITVKAGRERDLVTVEVADDGCGIDIQKVKNRALERGLISEQQLQSMRDYDVMQLICLPGFSTADKITGTSGRGVGMDVVKTAVEQIGGILEIVSEPGIGTRFIMKLPLSLAIARVLLVSVADDSLALPISRIVQTLEITREQIQRSGRKRVIEYKGQVVSLLSLRKILNYPQGPIKEPLPVVVTEVMGRRIGLVVDALIGQREVFVQRLSSPFDKLKGCSGATMLGDGHIVFVLDLQTLLETVRS